ncbi:MAG: HAD family hydrolase [Candidatus Nanoarchaeia archaeon]|nr:HAD family hydrolase [Candidatus Nanoarchaeia archaeon]MDD5239401.1 HAD family hydrolase [Candidatus Nanoarchaeia archaeon]
MKAVLFDLFGVLVDDSLGSFSVNFKRIFKPHMSLAGISEIKHKLYRKASEGKITRAQFWKLFFKKVGKFKNVESTLLDLRRLKEKSIHSVLRRLNKKYKLAIVSNHVDYWARYWLRKFKLTKYFDTIVISSAVKARKPDKKPYLVACKRLKVSPEECYYIGDGDDDIGGAKKLGMKTIFIPGESKNADADFKIKHLKELLNILKV